MYVKALVYNLILWFPLWMYLGWVVFSLIKDENLARYLAQAEETNAWDDPRAVRLAASAVFYGPEGRFSILSYFKTTWKHKVLFYKAVSLCLLLDVMQHDDFSNNAGQYFDDMAIDLYGALALSLLGALLFDYFFYRFIFLRYWSRWASSLKLLLATFLIWVGLVVAGGLSIAAIIHILGEAMTGSGVNKPIEYLLGFIFPQASALGLVYIYAILETKVALLPAALLVVLSSLSFALPAVIYVLVGILVKTPSWRSVLLRYTKGCRDMKDKRIRMLDTLQKNYWRYGQWLYVTIPLLLLL